MKAPDKIYLAESDKIKGEVSSNFASDIPFKTHTSIEYIRKDALLEWAEKELERLYELIPDAHKVEDETATPMEMRYLGQYMQMESVIDKLNEM